MDYLKMYKRCVSLLILIMLAGCSSVEELSVPQNYESKGQAFLDVPLLKQDNSYSCSTHALAMVMSYYSESAINPDKVWQSSNMTPKIVNELGNSMAGLEDAAKSFGYQSFKFVQLNVQGLKYLLDKGVPVIINVKNFYQDGYHAVVVTGYEKDTFYFNDPVAGKISLDAAELESHWQAYLSDPKGMHHKSGFILYRN